MAEAYTRTGNNIFSRVGRWASYFPIIGAGVSWVSGLIGAGVDAIGWLARGKLLSAVTALGAGAADAAVNSYASASGAGTFIYWGNLLSGVFTEGSLGSHTRQLTETIVSGVSRPLGIQPTVLASYTAGIGSIDAGASGPGYWAQRMTPEGQNAQQYYAMKMNNEEMSQHAAELESARSMPNYRTV